VRRLVAAFVVVIFTMLSTGDAWSCPDGCQSAMSTTAADKCNSSGACLFCTGGVVSVAAPPSPAPLLTELPAPVFSPALFSTVDVSVPDHPPRRG